MDIQETNRRVIEQFRAGGEIDGMQRSRLLLLTTTGRRSGQARTTPMMFHREDGRLFVIASNIGAAADPMWCLNLRADPQVSVEVGDQDGAKVAATAEILHGEERARLWQHLTDTYPFFADHAKAAAPREIPVVELVCG